MTGRDLSKRESSLDPGGWAVKVVIVPRGTGAAYAAVAEYLRDLLQQAAALLCPRLCQPRCLRTPTQGDPSRITRVSMKSGHARSSTMGPSPAVRWATSWPLVATRCRRMGVPSWGASASRMWDYAIARAIVKAAAAAVPPINIVWTAPRNGAVPVKCPLTQPKSPSATSVTITDTINAAGMLASAM
jgi:hypothetical protein